MGKKRGSRAQKGAVEEPKKELSGSGVIVVEVERLCKAIFDDEVASCPTTWFRGSSKSDIELFHGRMEDVDASTELNRLRVVRGLRKRYLELLEGMEASGPAARWIASFERWHMSALLEGSDDPLLPSRDSGVEVLSEELDLFGIKKKDVFMEEVNKALSRSRNSLEHSNRAMSDHVTIKWEWNEKLLGPGSQLPQSLPPSGLAGPEVMWRWAVSGGKVIELRGEKIVLERGKTCFRLNVGHFQKLRKLYCGVEKEFLSRVLCMLTRYEAMGGVRFQEAVLPAGMDCLRDRLGCAFECFSSPLTCRWRNYCSMFYDCDSVFGSKGNFFSIAPVEGSFEAHPPAIPSILQHTASRMETLLRHSARLEKALSFCVIVPKSQQDLFTKSAFIQHSVTLSSRLHAFTTGTQHCKRYSKVHVPTTDTSILILQTKSAADRHPVHGKPPKSISLTPILQTSFAPPGIPSTTGKRTKETSQHHPKKRPRK